MSVSLSTENISKPRRTRCLFGERVAERCSVLKVSQAELSRATGVTSAAFSHWMFGRNKISQEMAAKVAHLLDCEPDWLIEGIGYGQRHKTTDPQINHFQAGVGRRICEARTKRGMSQAGLAEQMGIAQMRVSMWERGTFMPSVPHLTMLCRALDVSADFVLGLSSSSLS